MLLLQAATSPAETLLKTATLKPFLPKQRNKDSGSKAAGLPLLLDSPRYVDSADSWGDP